MASLERGKSKGKDSKRKDWSRQGVKPSRGTRRRGSNLPYVRTMLAKEKEGGVC